MSKTREIILTIAAVFAIVGTSVSLWNTYVTPKGKLVADIRIQAIDTHPSVIQQFNLMADSLTLSGLVNTVSKALSDERSTNAALKIYNELPAFEHLSSAEFQCYTWTATVRNEGDKTLKNVELFLPKANTVRISRDGKASVTAKVTELVMLDDISPHESVGIIAWADYADEWAIKDVRLTHDDGIGTVRAQVFAGKGWHSAELAFNFFFRDNPILRLTIFLWAAIFIFREVARRSRTPPGPVAPRPAFTNAPLNVKIVSSRYYPLTVARGNTLKLEYVVESNQEIPDGVWLGASLWKKERMYARSNEDKAVKLLQGKHTYSRVLSIDPLTELGVWTLSLSLWQGPVGRSQESKLLVRVKPAGQVTVVES